MSPQTVLLRTTLTRTITLYRPMIWLPGSNYLNCYFYICFHIPFFITIWFLCHFGMENSNCLLTISWNNFLEIFVHGAFWQPWMRSTENWKRHLRKSLMMQNSLRAGSLSVLFARVSWRRKLVSEASWREEWVEEKWACTKAIEFWIPSLRGDKS